MIFILVLIRGKHRKKDQVFLFDQLVKNSALIFELMHITSRREEKI